MIYRQKAADIAKKHVFGFQAKVNDKGIYKNAASLTLIMMAEKLPSAHFASTSNNKSESVQSNLNKKNYLTIYLALTNTKQTIALI